MKQILYLMMLLCLHAVADDSIPPPGIEFQVLRVIYSDSDKGGATLTAYNKSTSSYLLQSVVRPVDSASGLADLTVSKKNTVPFIITPPLSMINENSDQVLRVRRTDVPLPEDRESVFYISIQALPSSIPTGQKMLMTTITNIKLFYRPKGLLKRAVEDIGPLLTFTREKDTLIAHNPTAYWLTFSKLSVGSVDLDKLALRQMLPPFTTKHYALPNSTTGKVSWQLIDEDGWNTPLMYQNMN